MATWIKCTNTKHEVVYINLDNAVTVTRNDVADRIADLVHGWGTGLHRRERAT